MEFFRSTRSTCLIMLRMSNARKSTMPRARSFHYWNERATRPYKTEAPAINRLGSRIHPAYVVAWALMPARGWHLHAPPASKQAPRRPPPPAINRRATPRRPMNGAYRHCEPDLSGVLRSVGIDARAGLAFAISSRTEHPRSHASPASQQAPRRPSTPGDQSPGYAETPHEWGLPTFGSRIYPACSVAWALMPARGRLARAPPAKSSLIAHLLHTKAPIKPRKNRFQSPENQRSEEQRSESELMDAQQAENRCSRSGSSGRPSSGRRSGRASGGPSNSRRAARGLYHFLL